MLLEQDRRDLLSVQHKQHYTLSMSHDEDGEKVAEEGRRVAEEEKSRRRRSTLTEDNTMMSQESMAIASRIEEFQRLYS